MNEEYNFKDEMDIKEQGRRIQLLEEHIEESTIKQKMYNAIWLLTIIITTIIVLAVLWKFALAVGIITITANGDFMISCIPGDFVTVLSHKAFL